MNFVSFPGRQIRYSDPIRFR